jgi:hypothetical protein
MKDSSNDMEITVKVGDKVVKLSQKFDRALAEDLYHSNRHHDRYEYLETVIRGATTELDVQLADLLYDHSEEH